jgi:hypothetical protein
MTTIFQVRHDTTVNWTAANTVLAAGEFGYDITLKQHKIGDGTTHWNDLLFDVGPKGDQGAGGNGGQTILDFGAEPGSNEANIAVSIPTILSTSIPVVSFASIDTSDHSANDHTWASLFIRLSCGAPVNGVGFTIYATSEYDFSGTFAINYNWV